jgi:hypothetical protein
MIDGERVYDCKKCHPDKLIATQRAFAKSSMHAEFDECKERCDKSPVDSVPAPVETANSNTKLLSCCVHDQLVAIAPVAVKPADKPTSNHLLEKLDPEGKNEVMRRVGLFKKKQEADERERKIEAAVKLEILLLENSDSYDKKCREINVYWEKRQAIYVGERDKKIEIAKADFELKRLANDNERDIALKKAEETSKAQADELSRRAQQ